MRVIFNEELKAVADDLDRMAQDVRKAINGAGDALLNQNLEAAQAVIDGDIEIDALESSVIDQCVKLLAKQNPVATDLRVVVSTLRLAATFERMGDLARHIAEAARRTYPASPLSATLSRNACISVALRFAVPLVSTLETSAERPCSEGFSNASPPE